MFLWHFFWDALYVYQPLNDSLSTLFWYHFKFNYNLWEMHVFFKIFKVSVWSCFELHLNSLLTDCENTVERFEGSNSMWPLNLLSCYLLLLAHQLRSMYIYMYNKYKVKRVFHENEKITTAQRAYERNLLNLLSCWKGSSSEENIFNSQLVQ